mgnify:CR=1 FL=1
MPQVLPAYAGMILTVNKGGSGMSECSPRMRG